MENKMVLFTKCRNGHVYNSDLGECPYCKGKKLDDDLEDLTRKKTDLPESAMCYDMGPQDFIDDFDANNEKSPMSPIPPPCYAPMPLRIMEDED